MKRDGHLSSLWQTVATDFPVNEFSPGEVYDVLIVGAGITGITTALELQKSGKRCVIAEASTICFGTTGGTTAHLNSFFDTPYDLVQKDFSKDDASLLAMAAKHALAKIKENVQTYHLNCTYEERTAYVFSVEEKQDEQLDKLVEASNESGVEMGFINDSPFPIPYRKIASVPGQAQFNPVLYLIGLVKEFIKIGGIVLEQTRVTGLEEGDVLVAHTGKGDINASNLIYATHIPPGVNLLHFRCAPYRSYVLACKLRDNKYPQALGYDLCEPYHYYRTQTELDGSSYLIAGGEDHKTGHGDNTEQCFRQLEQYVRQFYEIEEVTYKWSSQYFEPTDGLAYIGRLPGSADNVYTATGFSGNGMIYGTIASIVLPDLIITGDSPYKKLLDPSRIKPVAGFTNFVKESADVVGHFIGDRFNREKINELVELAAGEAKLVSYEGKLLAIYKDEQHGVYALNPACTHVKCTVHWNSAEKTWDCPCHGSRFNYDGTMFTGPARKDLERVDVTNDEG
jgi:glycine/D-amino acid oxidase-like deaminating enzyme/nitrite reductase/ring-hydroxylating ferredoxin subunit